MIFFEIQTQVNTITRTYQETQLALLRTIAVTVEGYTSLRNPHRIEVVSGWYEREIYTRFISKLRIYDESRAWLYTEDRLTSDDPDVLPAGRRLLMAPGAGTAAAMDLDTNDAAILQQIASGVEGVGKFEYPDGGGEEIISWVPITVGGEVWTVGMSTPMVTILDETGSRAHFRDMIVQFGVITALSLGIVGAWGREVDRRQKATLLLEQSNADLENRVLERTRELSQVNEVLTREVSEHQETELVLKRQVQRFEALHKIDTLISAAVDIHVTIHYMLEQVLAQPGVDAAAIYLLTNNGGKLELADGLGFRGNVSSFPPATSGEPWAGAAAFSGDPLFFHSIAHNPNGWELPPHLANDDFTSYLALPLRAKGEVRGVCEIYSRTGLDDSLEWVGFLETIAGTVAIAIDNAALMNQLQHKNIELTSAYDATLEGWSRAIELHDRESEGHSQRVVELTVRLARRMGIAEEMMVHIRRGALLHDIGKMGIPDTVLQKIGPLNGEERKHIQMHPEYAYRMLAPVAYLAKALDIPYCHHERWDGSGYPRGLKGKQIPLAARVFSVIDVWDALRSDRPYRRAWHFREARDFIQVQAGSQFDPEIVAEFLAMLEEDSG